MKGRTSCPKCKNDIVLDLPEDEKEYEVVCPNCNNKFKITAKCTDPRSNKECSWEEHGEPRKTILSSIKPKTNRPMIAGIILICVFCLGIATAIFSENFIESSLDLASDMGMTGSVKITVENQKNESIEGASVKIDGIMKKTNNDGVFYAEGVDLGIKTLEISYDDNKTQKREILVTPFFNFETTLKMENGSGIEELVKFNSSGCMLIFVIFSVFALLGTVACLKGKYLDIAIVGSLIGIFSFGFFFIGSILSIIAFSLIMKSKEEFENGKKGRFF